MKEIKFKAWDIKNKKMYCLSFGGVLQALLNLDQLIRIFSKYAAGDIYNFIKDYHKYYTGDLITLCYKFMQYVGCKDKNGNEVYFDHYFKCGDGYVGIIVLIYCVIEGKTKGKTDIIIAKHREGACGFERV